MMRPATTADAAALARICLLTGAAGADATALYTSPTALADVYATPYVTGPGCFAWVWEDAGTVAGYLLGTRSTRDFQEWFTREWWPTREGLHAWVSDADHALRRAARNERRMLVDAVDAYPAHLHIDLLPAVQGRGVGRTLMEAAVATLAGEGVPGLHLTADAANTGALAFYPRVGFTMLEDGPGVTFGRLLG